MAPANVSSSAHAPKPTPIGTMYRTSMLDCLIELVKASSDYFVDYPRIFAALGSSVSTRLFDFRYKTGVSEEYLSGSQRHQHYSAIFGAQGKDGHASDSQFHQAAAAVHAAALQYATQNLSEAQRILETAFHDTSTALKDHLSSFTGAVVDIGQKHTLSTFSNAVDVLREREFAAAFQGVKPAPADQDWPFKITKGNGDGALLLEKMGKALVSYDAPMITQHQVVYLQRVSFHGGNFLDVLLATDIPTPGTKESLSQIQEAYQWHVALEDLRKSWSGPAVSEASRGSTSGRVATVQPIARNTMSLGGGRDLRRPTGTRLG